VRKICNECREEVTPTSEQLSNLDLTPEEAADIKFYRGAGCPRCNSTGFKGRTGIHELMIMNDELREVVNRGGSSGELREEALRHGMRPLRISGLAKINEGITTIEEVVRETVSDV
jgi:type IV pilus assembly protein PilB